MARQAQADVKNTARGKRGHAASFERRKPTECETRRHHRGTQAWGRVFHRPFQGIAQAGLSGRAHDECTTTPPGVTVESKAEINRVFYQKRNPSQHEYNSPTYGNLALHLQEYGRIATRIFVKTEGHKVKIKVKVDSDKPAGKGMVKTGTAVDAPLRHEEQLWNHHQEIISNRKQRGEPILKQAHIK